MCGTVTTATGSFSRMAILNNDHKCGLASHASLAHKRPSALFIPLFPSLTPYPASPVGDPHLHCLVRILPLCVLPQRELCEYLEFASMPRAYMAFWLSLFSGCYCFTLGTRFLNIPLIPWWERFTVSMDTSILHPPPSYKHQLILNS